MKRTKLNLNFSSLTSHPFDFAQDDPESYRMGHLISRWVHSHRTFDCYSNYWNFSNNFFANYLGVRQRARDSQKVKFAANTGGFGALQIWSGTYPVPVLMVYILQIARHPALLLEERKLI